MSKTEKPQEKVGAVIAAAGASRRMGGADKIFLPLAGRPLLAHVIDVFRNCSLVERIVLVLNETNLERGRELIEEQGFAGKVEVCTGGERRQDSVGEGLKRLEGCRWAVIHDGARPCISVELIEQGLREARQTGAAIAAVPVKDTIKVIGAGGTIEDTPPRNSLWAAQTPQIFRFDIIEEAYRQAVGDVTDDAALVEALGHKVRVYMGSYENIKVTTPEDLALAEFILEERNAHRYRL